jgi:hypothetical protein
MRRGESAEVTFTGDNLGANPRLIAPFGFRPGEPEAKGSDAKNWKTHVVVDPGTPVGVYPVRVVTDDGLSNPFLLAVGQFAQVAEKEENNTFESAQELTTPVVVEGQAGGNDVDFFRFAGKKGQRIVIDAQCARIGSGVDPTIRLTTASRRFVASADDSPGLMTDARLVVALPEDGDYVLEISDSGYKGGARPVYRLLVGEVPIADEVYPLGGRAGETVGIELRGGTFNAEGAAALRIVPVPETGLAWPRVAGAVVGLGGPQAGMDIESLGALVVGDLPEVREPSSPNAPPIRAAAPVVLNGRIDPAGDEDRFVLAVTPGQKISIEVEAYSAGSALDGVLQVLDPKGAVLATADDTPGPRNPKMPQQQPTTQSPDPSLPSYTVPNGVSELTLALKDLQGRGGTGYPYRIKVLPSPPGFAVALNDSQINVPRGGTATVGATVERKGYTGKIQIKVVDLPAGLTLRGGAVADAQTAGSFTLSADESAKPGPVTLNIVAEAQVGETTVTVPASKVVVFAQQGAVPTNSVTFQGLATGLAPAQPVKLEAPAEPIVVAHGFGAPVAIKAVRGANAEGKLAITAVTPPAGTTAAAASLGEKDEQVTVTLNTTLDTPVGLSTVALQAKGKVGGTDLTLAVPAVNIDVVRPAAVEVAQANLEIQAGKEVELKGKVTRKGAFNEAVTVKLNGLPAGLKAEPVTVAADASEFTVKITADEKAAAASSSASVALAFQVNQKDYPAPPTAPLTVKVVAAK